MKNQCKVCLFKLKAKEEVYCFDCVGKDFSSMVKYNCFICGFPIKNSLERYLAFGNICSVCNVRADNVVKRKLTHAEADALIAERIKSNAEIKN